LSPFLSGKNALVTGASRGIGRACAIALAREGAATWLCARNLGELSQVRDEIRAEGGQAEALELDLGDFATLESRLEPVLGKGGADVLVNNAGITQDGLMLRMSDEQWDRVLDVDLGGTFRVTRALLRGMVKRRWGRIISISSVVACAGNAGQANYAAAKAGLIGLSRALAREVGSRDITVNVVAPGYVETAMTAGLTDEQKEKLLAAVPSGRMGTPDDVAAAVLYLASPQAGYVTGQVLHVNGGMYMG
jgi:3-oxoacyl-[acyl-carrier protein] reductase